MLYIIGLEFEEFCNSRMRYAAVIREFEIIGEAVGKLSEDLLLTQSKNEL